MANTPALDRTYTTTEYVPDARIDAWRSAVSPTLIDQAGKVPDVYGSKWVGKDAVIRDPSQPETLEDGSPNPKAYIPDPNAGRYIRDTSIPLTASQEASVKTALDAANQRVVNASKTDSAQGGLNAAAAANKAALGTDIAGANQGLYGAASRANIADAAGGLYQQAANAPVYGGLDALKQGQELYRQAGAANSGAAGQSQYNQAQNMYQNAPGAYNAYGNAASDLYGQSTDPTGLSSASPYLQAAAGKSTSGISDYMNPYNAAVTDQIAKLGARNLSENILPSISDQFVSGGQFGSTRQGQMSDRALRDTQEAILAQQSAALQAGYGQAAGLSATDLARQAQLAGTAGGLGTSQQQILQGAGAGLSNIGATGAGIGMQAAQGIQGIGASNIQASQADLARMVQAATGLNTSAMTVGQLANMAGQLQLQAGQGLTSAAQAQAANQIASGNAMTNAALGSAANQNTGTQNALNLATTNQDVGLKGAAAEMAAAEGLSNRTQADIDAERVRLAGGNSAIIDRIGSTGAALTSAGAGSGTSNQIVAAPAPNQTSSTIGNIVGGINAYNTLKKASGGPIKKNSLTRARYGNIPRRGLGMFARAT